MTTNPALVNRMIIVCINERFNMLGCSRSRHTIHHFRFIRVEKAMSYLSDVYDALITEIDFYAMNVSLLIGRESFEIDKTGQLEVNPEGVAVACERNRKRILGLVALHVVHERPGYQLL